MTDSEYVRIDRACGQPCFENDVTITKLEPCGTVGQPTGGSHVTLIALKRLSLPGPPWSRTTYLRAVPRMSAAQRH